MIKGQTIEAGGMSVLSNCLGAFSSHQFDRKCVLARDTNDKVRQKAPDFSKPLCMRDIEGCNVSSRAIDIHTCMCMFIYIYVLVTHIYVCMYIYIYMYLHVYIHRYIYIQINAYTSANIHIYVYLHISDLCIFLYTYICICMYNVHCSCWIHASGMV